jgi:hypothetical protein
VPAADFVFFYKIIFYLFNRWFQGFDWDGLASLSLIPPLIRKVSGPYDTNNFDLFPTDSDIPPDETSGWDSDF